MQESYSMSSAASLNDGVAGTDEDAGLSISDIVRHAVKTVISVMGPGDRLSLVGFSSRARRVMGLTTMDEAGIAAAMASADDLGPKNSTNLWAGVKEGLDVLHESLPAPARAASKQPMNKSRKSWLVSQLAPIATAAPQRLKTIMLLTDGVPNVEPDGGHLAALGEYFRTHPGLDSVATINTFGFGYSLDSPLLKQLSVRGAGMYSFIPDASFVGTAFVNALSNIRTTAATGATLELAGVTAVDWLGSGCGKSRCSDSASACSISFGSIQIQQPRHLVARITTANDAAAGLAATLRCNAWDCTHTESVTLVVDPAVASNTSASFAAQSARLRFVDAIGLATALHQGGMDCSTGRAIFHQPDAAAAQAAMQDFVSGTANPDGGDGGEYVAALLVDATGQATKALSKDVWFHRWGKHYLPSLAQAHLQQQCNNFKDPGVQLYGGAMFEQARDEADDAFLSLPPPAPSRATASARVSRGSSSGYCSGSGSPQVSMSRYHCAGNGCFHGASMITMSDGTAKRVDQLRKGDSVVTPAGPATVGCVVENICANSTAELVALGNGLLITPYHPVRAASGEWKFPHSMAPRVIVICAAVYNVVLDRGHEVVINGVQCVTLAHGFDDSAVIRHAFFGTDRVTAALKQLSGWANGWVRIQPSSLLRSRSTGRVIGYAPQKLQKLLLLPPPHAPLPPPPSQMVSA